MKIKKLNDSRGNCLAGCLVMFIVMVLIITVISGLIYMRRDAIMAWIREQREEISDIMERSQGLELLETFREEGDLEEFDDEEKEDFFKFLQKLGEDLNLEELKERAEKKDFDSDEIDIDQFIADLEDIDNLEELQEKYREYINEISPFIERILNLLPEGLLENILETEESS